METGGAGATAKPAEFVVQVPILGVISAGLPIAAAGQQENPYAGETLALAEDVVPAGGETYALRVKGDSMIDALVADGDWIVIRHQVTAQPRDMIVAWIKDREETTLGVLLTRKAPGPAATG